LNTGFDPKKGDALLWWNLTEDGREDVMTLHAGEPVLAGEKWALNLWLRERPNRAETEENRKTENAETF
jgi:prolyl 4-hydroxylase